MAKHRNSFQGMQWNKKKCTKTGNFINIGIRMYVGLDVSASLLCFFWLSLEWNVQFGFFVDGATVGWGETSHLCPQRVWHPVLPISPRQDSHREEGEGGTAWSHTKGRKVIWDEPVFPEAVSIASRRRHRLHAWHKEDASWLYRFVHTSSFAGKCGLLITSFMCGWPC